MPQVLAVTGTPDSSSFPAGTQQTVKLATGTAGATIYYTTDGSNPLTSASRVAYTKPLTIGGDTIVTAAAVKDGMEPSDAAVFKYYAKMPFRNFNGINQGPDQDLIGNMAWNRFDFSWGSIEPAKGQLNQNVLNELKDRVLQARKTGSRSFPSWPTRPSGRPIARGTHTISMVLPMSSVPYCRSKIINSRARSRPRMRQAMCSARRRRTSRSAIRRRSGRRIGRIM